MNPLAVYGIVLMLFAVVFVNYSYGQEYDVIIVGAGAAGLGAANQLKELGIDNVIILEAQDRWGGRVQTDRPWGDDVALDMGAAWISGTDGNPIAELANEYKAETKETDYENSVLYYSDGTASDVDTDTVFRDFEDFYNKYIEKKTVDEPLKNIVDAYIEDLKQKDPKPTEAELRYLNFTINVYIENEWAGSAETLSALHFGKVGYKLGEIETDVTFTHGYDQITNGLANKFGEDKILLNQLVTKIKSDDDGVTVYTDNNIFNAKYVIVTVPLGILQKELIDFEPDLPAKKMQAINNLKLGVLDKAYFLFPEVFWDKYAHVINYVPKENGQWAYFLNLYPSTEQKILVALNPLPYATKLETMSDDEIKDEGLKVLNIMYPGKVPDADKVKIHVTRWGQNEYTGGGSYSYIPYGGTLSDYDVYAQPFGRVFFAGEATTKFFPGLVNGALVTGIREANRVWAIENDYPSVCSQKTGLPFNNAVASCDNKSKWGHYPEYIICNDLANPPLEIAVLKHTDTKNPICVTKATKQTLLQRDLLWVPKGSFGKYYRGEVEESIWNPK